MLGHSLEPGRCYHEVARIGASSPRRERNSPGLEPDFDVTLLLSSASKWAMEFHPP